MILAACGGADEKKAVYLEKAKSSIEAGDLEKARIELKNVLQIDPKDEEAYYHLGTVYEQQKDYRKAYGHYLKAEELNPEFLPNQARIGRIYIVLLNDLVKAQEKIDLILSKEPDNADALLLKAAVTLRNKDIKGAIAVTQDIVAKNPNHTESVAYLATLYMQENKLTDAINLLDTALKKNENNEYLNKLLAVALRNNKEYDRAEVIYKNFLERNPDNSIGYNNLATFYNQTDNKIKAEETLRASIENNKSDVARQLLLVKYIRSIRSSDAAINELKDLIAKHNGLGKLRMALVELYLNEGNKKSAIEVCAQAIIDFPEEETGVSARITLASIEISEGNYDKAIEVVEEAILISPNNPEVNFMRAKLALRDKDIEKAIISLRIVTKAKPENVVAYILLANVYQLEKNKEQVNSILNTAYANNKTNADGLLKLAQYQLTRDIDNASQIIDDYNNLKEGDYDGLSIKASILNQGQVEEKYEGYNIAKILMESYPDKPNGYMLTIPYLTQRHDNLKAASVLEKGYLSTKDNRKLLVLLTALQMEDKKFDIAEKRIEAELTAAPEDDDLKFLLTKVYLSNNKDDAAENLLKEIVDNGSTSEAPYTMLAEIYLSKNDNVKAISTLEKGYINTSNSRKILYSLTKLQLSEKQFDAVEGRITEELKASPEDVELKILLSKVYLKNKKIDDAENLLEEVIDKNPLEEEAYLLLSKIYESKKEMDSVEGLLLKGKNNIPSSMEIPLVLAGIYERYGKHNAAIDIYRELHLSNSDNLIIINNLTSMLSDYSEDKEDLELIRALAVKLRGSGQFAFLDTVGWVYYRLGDYQNAVQTLSQVVEKRPNVNIFNYHLGMAFKMNGDKDQAKLYLEKSLADKKPFKQKGMAEAALKGL